MGLARPGVTGSQGPIGSAQPGAATGCVPIPPAPPTPFLAVQHRVLDCSWLCRRLGFSPCASPCRSRACEDGVRWGCTTSGFAQPWQRLAVYYSRGPCIRGMQMPF